ncbi:MAG: hypothetical protein GQ557_01535 [Mycoplasmataceae bacterium]|nr:hypothetical protein [Mycoplasmataceae bacterium]
MSRLNNNEKENKELKYSLWAIFVGLISGIILLFATGQSVADFFYALYLSNFSSWRDFGALISMMTWIILMGLAFLVSFRAGIFNIGAVGQFVGAGIVTFIFISVVPITGRWAIILTIIIPVITGMSIAYFIAFLKNTFKVNEVLSSIFINLIIYWIYKWLTNPAIHPNYATNSGSTLIPGNYSLQLFGLGAAFNITIFFAIFALITMFLMYRFTTWGYKQDLLASDNKTATYVGLNYKKEFSNTFVLSGGLAGLAGASYYFGFHQNLPAIGTELSIDPWVGLTAALIAFNNPLGLLFSGLFIAIIQNSRDVFELLGNTAYMIDIIMAVFIFIFAISNAMLLYDPHEKLMEWFKSDDLGGSQNFESNLYPENKKIKSQSFVSKNLDYFRRNHTIYYVRYKELKNKRKKGDK